MFHRCRRYRAWFGIGIAYLLGILSACLFPPVCTVILAVLVIVVLCVLYIQSSRF